jgi:hypothetical protein
MSHAQLSVGILQLPHCTDKNRKVFCKLVAESEERFSAIENSSDGRPADIDTRSNEMINVRSLYRSESTFVLMCTSFIE